MYPIIYINNEPYMNHTFIQNNGNISCSSPGRLVLTDTWFTCACYQFAFVLEMLGFGYITALLCVIIIIITFFGGIKENYKWFIFNQAIWDLFVSYDLICNKPTNAYFNLIFEDVDFRKKAWNQGNPTCFYPTIESPDNAVFSWTLMVQRSVAATLVNIQYFMTFSLAFSRFLAMYFPIFYARHTSKRKLIKILILYNLFTVFLLNIHLICDYFIKHQIINECFCQTCKSTLISNSAISACIAVVQNKWWRFTINGLRPAVMSIWLLLSSVFTYAVLFKILLHIKFQYQNNQKTLSSSLRICFALFFTAFVFSLYFIYVFTQELMAGWITQILLQIGLPSKTANLFVLATPFWLSNLKNTKQSLNNLRIFIECMLALIVLSGYREGFIKIIKTLFFYLLHPTKGLKAANLKARADNSTVVVPYK